MAALPWLDVGEKLIGTAEIPGPKHSAVIIKWLEKLRAWWRSDEVPWCGVFVAHCLVESGLPIIPLWMRAKAWADYGEKIPFPIPGCIVVFDRVGGGHVGFAVGETREGRLLVLGGNQGNKVSVAAFDRSRVLCYVWPSAYGRPNYSRFLLVSSGELSKSEA